ncbi:condensation domain-containing protein [Promicromonospora sukumoe]|uniref:condensation domain-containing protein n=1 Tax=Promicromonospora sukumoe TaxID=88382 RepID=UPI0037CC897E
MEYTELSDYDLPAGVVTSWTPRADAGRWHQDPRDLSPGHEAHLRDSEPGSWIGSVLRVPGPYEPEPLRRAIHAWVSRHEVLRTTVTRDAGAGWRRVTAPAEAVAIRDLVVGDLTGDQVTALLPSLLADVSPTAWPHCVLATVVPEPAGPGSGDESFVLAFGADHSVMDAYSQLLWFEEIVSLYDAARRGVPDAELRALEVGSHVDFSADDRKLAMTLASDGEPVHRWLDFLGAGATFPRYGSDGITHPAADDAEAHRRQASRSEWLATTDQTDDLSARSRARGASAQSGVLALFAHAARRVHGIDRLRFVLPMHTRYAPQHAAAVGWYVGLCPVDLDLDGVDPVLRALDEGRDSGHVVDGTALTAAVERVHAAVAAGKPLVRYSFARIAELGGITDGPHLAVSYVDTRFVPGAERWSTWDARTLRSPAYGTDELYLWFLRTHDGLNVSARHPDTPEAHTAMDALVEELRACFRAFGTAGLSEAVA